MFVVGQELLGIFREAVTAITEARIVVVRTDTWIQSYTLDDVLGTQSLHFGVCIQFVEVTHAECQIGVREEFYGFGFGQTHEQHIYLLLNGAFY